MTLNFDLKSVKSVEFGLGRDNGDARTFTHVAVDQKVQATLQQMAEETYRLMPAVAEPTRYEPSEKYGSIDYVYLPLDNDLSAPLKDLHMANNLPIDSKAFDDPSKIFCYFVRMTDAEGRRLTALRRATQFKGVLKHRNHLIRLVDDSLQVIESSVFKLDNDFDMIVDSERVHILRPSGFEFVGQLQAAILSAVPGNVTSIQKDLKFVDFSSIQDYAIKHPRAARYLASIRSQEGTKNIDQTALKAACQRTGVEIDEASGKLSITSQHVMGFLEVLDRRRYEIELVKDAPEQFRASSRQKLRRSSGGP